MDLIVNIQNTYSFLSDWGIKTEVIECWFASWLSILSSNLPEAESYELSLRITDDREIQQFNSQYRHRNQPTDVLAFAALEVDLPQLAAEYQEETLYLGDIVISLETAQDQAQRQGHSLSREVAWLSAHGLLHLLGWDHPDEASLEEMLKQQEILLQNIGVVS